MRMLLKVTIPTETGNDLVRRGTLGSTIQNILEELKPEAAYFVEYNGERTGFIVADLASESGIPAMAEPFFLALNARVECRPAMTPQDLAAALPAIEKARAQYAGK